ncbi:MULTISPECIES: hypothetical protein [Glaesserella]|nr:MULTISPECIES: hypothetical protein [Glaesserella]
MQRMNYAALNTKSYNAMLAVEASSAVNNCASLYKNTAWAIECLCLMKVK